MTTSPNVATTPLVTTRALRIAGFIAVFAAALGCVADLLLLYSPHGGYTTGDYRFLLDISPTRLIVGHFLGVVCIPFELCGLWQIYHAVKASGVVRARWLAVVGTFTFFPGVVYHGTVAFIGLFLHTHHLLPEAQQAVFAPMLAQYKWLSEPLGALVFVGLFALCALLSITVWRRQTLFPRWVLWSNPLLSYGLFALAYFVWPTIGHVLLPAGFNLALLIFFATTTLSLRPWSEHSARHGSS